VSPIGHIAAGSTVPTWAAWLLAATGGIAVVLLLCAPRWWRVVGLCAALGVVAVTIATSRAGGNPSAGPAQVAGISVTVEPQAGAADGVVVSVCVPGPRRVHSDGRFDILLVTVDGSQVAEGSTTTFSIRLAAGRHHLVVELIDPDHRTYNPRLTAAADLEGNRPAALQTPVACPL
jgi:hypothetical protein